MKSDAEAEVFQVSGDTELSDQPGLPGETLYHGQSGIRRYLLIIVAYAVTVIGFAVYISRCPLEATGIRALSSWNINVAQFYSGIVLSALLTPAAIVIRRIAYDVALLHPFAITSMQPTSLKDIDDFMDPGLTSTLRLYKYSFVTGIVQTLLICAGAVLVPIGTLLVYTGSYTAPVAGTGVAGIPGLGEPGIVAIMDLSVVLPMPEDESVNGRMVDLYNDFLDSSFLRTTSTVFTGDLIRLTGVLPEPVYELGPESTTNLTYEDGKRYDGIVTFQWGSGCRYTDKITYTEATGTADWMFNITFPTGDKVTNSDAWDGRLSVSNSTNGKEFNVFYAVTGTAQETTNMDEAQAAGAIEVADGAWISRVACTPTLDWQVSSCLWTNSSMMQCYPAPGSNTTAIDTVSLDTLLFFMSAIPLAVDSHVYGITGDPDLLPALTFDPSASGDHQYRAPLLSDFEKMYGHVARTIASVVTSGYYGTAEVPTVGSTPRPVYLVREYILGILVAIFILVPLMAQGLLLWYRRKHAASRRATFLTVANAVRGPQWDAILHGGCVAPHSQLRKRHAGLQVMFGVDPNMPDHVGFAPDVLPVQRGASPLYT